MTWTASAGAQLLVYAQALQGTTWSPVGADFPNDGGKLNNDPAKKAGAVGMQEARVAASANGGGVVVFSEGETGSEETNVFARRLAGTTRGAVAQASIATLGGAARPLNGMSDMPDVNVNAAGNAWVVFREIFVYNVNQQRPRALARRLAGDTFEDAQVIDGLPEPPPTEGAEFPRVEVTAAGRALAAHPRQLSFETWASELTGATWTPGFQASTVVSNTTPFSVAALGENGAGAVAWRQQSVNMGPIDINLRTA